MAGRRIELKVLLTDELSEDQAGVNQFEVVTNTLDEMMAASEIFQLPIDTDWTMSVIFYDSIAPPTRVYVTYDIEGEELVIIEKRKKEKYRHTTSALAKGGPIPINHVLGLMENSLALVREWISW